MRRLSFPGEAGEESRRSVAEVQRRCQDNLQIVVIKLIHGSSDDPREILGLDQRQRYPNEKRAATDKRTRDPVGGEAKLAHSVLDPLAGRRRNVRTPVHHT